ncbi:Inner membrane protein YqaA [Pseudovibrio sp. Ad13]|uniref:YqaA family protein n=1 Tax=Pseudovibrio sp. Ad13 TaxID=989396 RepID=UPI0007AE4E50|nr:YqaA family protein [Pseudovibrio sp. Ad13]KZK87524.1 Inner membrane protein YqaA [Pseudovibrio sp. Ad13]
MLVALGVYGGLFAFSFLAATLAPGSSEAVLSGLLLAGGWDPIILIASASLGNVAGSVFNWYCGRFLSHYKDRSWFPVKEHQFKQAVRWFKRYGQASMLLAWVPVIGDPLTLIAGTLRMKFINFLVLVAIGKVARYLFVYYAVTFWQG